MSQPQDDTAAATAGNSKAAQSGPTAKEALFFMEILNNMKTKPEVSISSIVFS
jgi:hypothetical protein